MRKLVFNVFESKGSEYIGRSWLKDPADVEPFLDGLRKAGLPE